MSPQIKFSPWQNMFEMGVDDLFRDLNDMERVLEETQTRIDNQTLALGAVPKDEDGRKFFVINDPYESLYTAIGFIDLDKQKQIQTLVVFTNVTLVMPLRFTLGYAVAPRLRGEGRGLAAVTQNLQNFEWFLTNHGPDRLGSFTDQEVELDVVIDQSNSASQKLAEIIRPANSAWQIANEERSDRACRFYSMPLRATLANQRRSSLFLSKL